MAIETQTLRLAETWVLVANVNTDGLYYEDTPGFGRALIFIGSSAPAAGSYAGAYSQPKTQIAFGATDKVYARAEAGSAQISARRTVDAANFGVTTLGALTISATSYVAGTAENVVIGNITGKMAGSTIQLWPLTSQLVKVSADGTQLLVGPRSRAVGTFSYALMESHPNAPNSPKLTPFSLTISAPLSISGQVPFGRVGQAYQGFLPTVAGGSGSKTISMSGTLPAGLTFDATSGVTGTPTQAGGFDGVVFSVTDSTGTVAMPAQTLQVYREALGGGGVTPPPVTSGLRIVGNLTRANYASDVTTSGNEARESRYISYLGRQPVSEIWLVYTNWWLDLGAGGNETLNGNAVTLSAALEYNGTTVVAPNASLASPMIMADGATVEVGPFKAADFGLSEFPAQAQIFPRTRMVVAVGERIPRTGQIGNQAPASRKTQATADASNLTGTGVIPSANNQNVGGPNMVVGKTATAELAILTLNDSIGEGNSDSQQILVGQGYFDRAAANVSNKIVPLAHMGRHGGTLLRFTLNGQTRRIALAKYATDIYIALGANDLFTSANYTTTFQTNFRSLCSALKAINPSVRLRGITVAPRSQSNDKFKTAAGQIDQGSWDSATIKTQVNDWMKTTLVSESVLASVFDINAAWSTDGGNATWLTNGTDYYGFPGTNPDGPGANNPAGVGTITAATNSTAVTGAGTAFTTAASVGQFLYIGSGASAQYIGRIASIQSDTALTLEANAVTARSAGTYNISERQNATHPGPSLNILAGTALASSIASLTI